MKYVVSEKALETIERECRKFPDMETGGILVGFREESQAIVTHATGPGPNSRRSASHFIKDTAYQQSVLNLYFEYYGVNYMGVWHKHPLAMPFPSSGDIASAMDEISDGQVGLEELLTPICVMEAGQVEIVPYVMKDGGYTRVSWEVAAHDKLPTDRSVETQWYATGVGHSRFSRELVRFKEMGVAAEVRKGPEGTYRFHAPLGPSSPLRLVMLCYSDYPVTAPEVAVYNELSKEYEPLSSEILDGWDIDRFMADIFHGYLSDSHAAPAALGRDSSTTQTIDLPQFPRPGGGGA